MTTVTSASPRVIFNGIEDNSRGANERPAERFGQHVPLIRLFTETGPTEPTLVSGNGASFEALFGAQSLNPRSKFFNINSLLASLCMGEGNAIFVKRLVPEDAPAPARLIVAADVVTDSVPAMLPDGTPELSGGEEVLVDGVRMRLVLITSPAQDVGALSSTAGANTNGSSDQSVIYPLFELPTSFIGSMGNLSGIKIWAPTENDANPVNNELAVENNTRIFRIQFLGKSSANASPSIVPTILGSNFVDVTFKQGVVDTINDRDYYVGDVLINSYEDDGTLSATEPVFSPFSRIFVYQSNIATVQGLIFTAEAAANPGKADVLRSLEEVDFLTGMYADGEHYRSLYFEGPADGGINLGANSPIYASGGGDGTISLDDYNLLVDADNDRFAETYESPVIYPFTVVYDTGLRMSSKMNLMQVLGARQDVRVVFTTFVEGDDPITQVETELSRATALQTAIRAYPESALYSTGVARAEVIAQSGRLTTGNYVGEVPQLLDYAVKWARYAGGQDLRQGLDIDTNLNNRVTLVGDLNVKSLNQAARDRFWAAGATFSQPYDRASQYYPAIRSVYSDDTSVLVSPITVSIACDLIRNIFRLHAEISGNALLTPEQVIERSNNFILELAAGRYNNRVTVTPDTFFTEGDRQRGYSWHVRVNLAANNPNNVMTFELQTTRAADAG